MKQAGQYPTTQAIISLLGVGVLLGGLILFPGLGVVAKGILDVKRKREWEQQQKYWKKFNPRLLKRNLKRLYEQQVVEIVERNGEEIVKLTQKGQAKFLRFKLKDISQKAKYWDGKWRVIIYDIQVLKKPSQENFRNLLKQMNFLAIQKSVYLTPYPCKEAIEYLREYFGLSEEVIMLDVINLENEKYYKEYFGFK